MSNEDKTPPVEYHDRQLWAMGYSKEDRMKIITVGITYGLNPTSLGTLIRTSFGENIFARTKETYISNALDVEAYHDYKKAKQILSTLGYTSISHEQYESMQQRIADLGVEIGEWAKIADKGFTLMYNITEAITYNNEADAKKGNWALPLDIIIEMNAFIQALHDMRDKHLPLIKD